MWRELRGLGLNSCVALRKPLISEANREKRLQFSRSIRFSNIMSPKNEVSWLPEYTEWAGYSISGFFSSSLMARAFSKMTMESGSGSMRHHSHTWIGHRRERKHHWEPLGCAGEDSPIITTRSWRTWMQLDGNDCCDIAEGYRNDAAACCNQSWRRVWDFFFFGREVHLYVWNI